MVFRRVKLFYACFSIYSYVVMYCGVVNALYSIHVETVNSSVVFSLFIDGSSLGTMALKLLCHHVNASLTIEMGTKFFIPI